MREFCDISIVVIVDGNLPLLVRSFIMAESSLLLKPGVPSIPQKKMAGYPQQGGEYKRCSG